MSDSTDDAEDYLYRSQVFCQNPKHRGFKNLWLHECVGCVRELHAQPQTTIEDDTP